jgi:Cu(I)/Ag(I) efflux system membrane fusion protein
MNRVVLATGEGKFKSVKVTTGLRSKDKVEILEGLEEGDEVVVSAQFLIDSESSISSDFMRMTPMAEMPEIAWATGTVEELYADENIVLINHLPVPEWKWPSMQMEFSYAPDILVENLAAGSSVQFSMRKLESGEILIESIKDEMGAGQ